MALLDEAFVEDLTIKWNVNFESSVIEGNVLLSIKRINPSAKQLVTGHSHYSIESLDLFYSYSSWMYQI